MLNLPNALTVSRILLVPLLVVVLLTRIEDREWYALGLFLLAASTDFLDGFIARRWKKITRLGKLLDPAADKILISAAFISLVELGVAPAWMVMVIIAREFAVSSLRSFAASDSVVIPAGWSGKVKTVVQVVAISLLIIYERLGELSHLAPLSLWLAVIVSVLSGVEYFVRFGRLIWRGEAPSLT
ncbi:MAG TPA: CDP-diacylglycerol--glycerol-3-phosphate 3-phosphatidyltransferase [Thermoanaerobaculia bacterium]|nr:CDP-diacylglycerol--glycerol-3-phosphate 3-phosphatidyltransferase [Thermoanaerobaculia bacterium]